MTAVASRAAIVRALADPARIGRSVLPVGSIRRDDATGLPVVVAGSHAVVAQGVSDRRLALKCHLVADPERGRRLREVAAVVAWLDGLVVTVDHHPDGLQIARSTVDVTTMPWVEGDDLLTWLDRHGDDSRRVATLARSFAAVVGRLHAVSAAHGDLQPGSIRVTAQDHVVLVDVDGMYVPALASVGPCRSPHPHYSPPGGVPWSPEADRYATWTIYASLVALSHEPDLWQRVPDAGEGRLLLGRRDHADLAGGPAVQVLANSGVPAVRAIASHLAELGAMGPSLPPLDVDTLPEPADRPWWATAVGSVGDRRRRLLDGHEETDRRRREALDGRLAVVRARRREVLRALDGAESRRPARDLSRHVIAIELGSRLARPVIDGLTAAGVVTAADVTWSGDLGGGSLTVGGKSRSGTPYRLSAVDRRVIGLWRGALAPAAPGTDDGQAATAALVAAARDETAVLAAARIEARGRQAALAMGLGALHPAAGEEGA